jgi:hypothetical protein
MSHEASGTSIISDARKLLGNAAHATNISWILACVSIGFATFNGGLDLCSVTIRADSGGVSARSTTRWATSNRPFAVVRCPKLAEVDIVSTGDVSALVEVESKGEVSPDFVLNPRASIIESARSSVSGTASGSDASGDVDLSKGEDNVLHLRNATGGNLHNLNFGNVNAVRTDELNLINVRGIGSNCLDLIGV